MHDRALVYGILSDFHNNLILTWQKWPEPNDSKPDPNRQEKKLNRFRPEIRNSTDPKPNRPKTIMVRFNPKSEMTRTKSEPTQTRVDPMWLITRNEPKRIRMDLNSPWPDINPNPKWPEPNYTWTDLTRIQMTRTYSDPILGFNFPN